MFSNSFLAENVKMFKWKVAKQQYLSQSGHTEPEPSLVENL